MYLKKLIITITFTMTIALVLETGSQITLAEEPDTEQVGEPIQAAMETEEENITSTTGTEESNSAKPTSKTTSNTTEKTTSKTSKETATTTETSKKETTTASDKKKKKQKSTEKKITQSDKVVDITKEKKEPDNTGETKTEVIPKIYNNHNLEMKDKKETINGYIYFNQADAAWNDNGYRIKQAGCGPTSMAVVISSLTGKWVTPLDTTVWAYENGYYSSDGSVHGLIPALAKKYNLDCEGVGTNIEKIRTALKNNNPVVCLMGPGYFTSGGHFMVLVGIDKNDNVTVADVGSRERSQYKYKLKDIIAQSKDASAGGPFWVIERPGDEKETETNKTDSKKTRSTVKMTYEVMKDADEETVIKTVKDGYPVMMMTDSKVLDSEEFIYITVVNSTNLVTVTDRDFKNQKQISLSELRMHLKSDATGLSYWKVTGNCEFLMPLSKKTTSTSDKKTKTTEATTEQK